MLTWEERATQWLAPFLPRAVRSISPSIRPHQLRVAYTLGARVGWGERSEAQQGYLKHPAETLGFASLTPTYALGKIEKPPPLVVPAKGGMTSEVKLLPGAQSLRRKSIHQRADQIQRQREHDGRGLAVAGHVGQRL